MNRDSAAAASAARLAGWLAFVLLFVVVQYETRRTGPGPPADFLYRWDVFVGGLVQGAFVVGIVLVLARGGPVAEALALRRPPSWGRALGLSVVVFLVVGAVAAALDPILGASEEQGFVPEAWDPDRAAPFAANALLAALVFPAAEELLFRGVGYSLLVRYGTAMAIAATAALFSLAHGLVNALPILLALGIGLGWLRSRTDSVLPCILVHAAFNATALIGVVLVGERG